MTQDPLELAARALHHRDRSRRDLEERLAKAGVDGATTADALDTLERVGCLDDGRFAAARAESMAGRGYGDGAIRHDLEAHGVSPEALEAAIAGLEPEAVRAVVLVERLGRSAATGARLARKGFGGDSLESALGEIAVDGP